LAREALDKEEDVNKDLRNSELMMCDRIAEAVATGVKLSNDKIKKMQDELDQKLPTHYEKVN
jgi:hypothetical protein